MNAWNLKLSAAAGGLADWFLTRLATARRLLPAAELDTILPDGGEDFAQTITTELLDVVGTADASPAADFTAGVITTTIGDPVIFPSLARIAPTGAGSHLKDATLESWYAASLFKYTQPLDATQLADTRQAVVGLFQDANNYVEMGVRGVGSGGSVTNWMGSFDKDSSIIATPGPLLDGVESPVWHLAEMWFDVDTGKLHFALDGTEFAGTLDVADMPIGPMTLSNVGNRQAAGDPAILNVDKWCVIVKAQTVGGI